MLGIKQKNSKTDPMSRRWLVTGALVTTAMGAGAYALRRRRNAGGADEVPDAAASDTFAEATRDLSDPATRASAAT